MLFAKDIQNQSITVSTVKQKIRNSPILKQISVLEVRAKTWLKCSAKHKFQILCYCTVHNVQ